jgi:two-component system chemotaxis sensor kinase CheA
MDDFEKELKQGFLEEASQGVEDTESCFLALEQDPTNEDHLNKIFRLAHNLKGSSRAVGFEDLGEFTHHFESFILKIKNKELEPTPQVVNVLLQANDFVREMLEIYKQDLNAKIAVHSKLGLFELQQNDSPNSLEASLASQGESPEEIIAHDQAPNLAPPSPAAAPISVASSPAAPAASSKSATTKATAADESIRVALSRVEKLINYVGEITILQSVLREQAMQTDSLPLRKSVQQLSKLGKELQELAMSLRLVPVKPIFQKMQRIVRDTSLELNKDIQFIMRGEDTEVDKAVADLIGDPLVHLVRNAVDHGVEAKEERVAKGKDPRGTVILTAEQNAGRLIIRIQDDGKGLDPEKLIQKAKEKKILRPDANLTVEQAYQLIFAPGFSTKEVVTDISGRGVGMDVVKTNIEQLGGTIQIESAVGKGSTFLISLPLSVSIMDAFIVRLEQEKFVVPVSQIHETIKITPEISQKSTALGTVIQLRDQSLPFLYLGQVVNTRTKENIDQTTGLVIRSSHQDWVLGVDEVVSQQSIVVKPLSPELSKLKGISGTTILGDGKPYFILDTNDLAKIKASPSTPLARPA